MKETLEPQLVRIAEIIKDDYSKSEHIGLLSGRSGLALFQFYCAKYFDDDSYAEVGVEILSSITESIDNGYSYATYCNGIAGFCWTVQHLVEHDFIDLDVKELLDPFDSFLFFQQEFELNNGNYDFLHGAMGYAFYFLSRYLGSSDNESREKYETFLESFVLRMEEMAIPDGPDFKWESVLDEEKGDKVFNLGLSHGMSSIVYFFCRLYDASILRDKLTPLINGAIGYILRFENKGETGFSLFPNWIVPGSPPEHHSRLAWCYGDIGIAIALGTVGRTFGKPDLETKSEEILLHSAKRVRVEETIVVDAGFCHGSYGNAHMFESFAARFKNDRFKEIAEFWLTDGIDKHTGDALEPYRQYNHMRDSWAFDIDVLEGVAGIGLCMIDYLSEENNTWDECLMLR